MVLDALPEPVRDAIYTVIGFPSVAWTDLQARRQPLADELSARLATVRSRFAAVAQQLADRLPDIELPELTIPEVTMPTFTFPDIKLPDIKLPDIKLPTVKRPEVKLPEFSMPGAMSIDELSTRFDDQVKAVEARVNELEARVEAVLDRVTDQLPDPARDAVSQARDAAKEARTQLRALVGRPLPEADAA